MMKNFIVCCFILINGASICIASMQREEDALRKQTRLLQQGYSASDFARQAARGAIVGGVVVPAAIGAGVMTYEEGILPSNLSAGMAGGLGTAYSPKYRGIFRGIAGITAALNVARNYALLQWQIKKISNVLAQYTKFEFKSLSEPYAMIVVAAYKRNIPLLKSMIELHENFVQEEGIWKALTELFFNKKPTGARKRQLKKLIQEA